MLVAIGFATIQVQEMSHGIFFQKQKSITITDSKWSIVLDFDLQSHLKFLNNLETEFNILNLTLPNGTLTQKYQFFNNHPEATLQLVQSIQAKIKSTKNSYLQFQPLLQNKFTPITTQYRQKKIPCPNIG